MRSVLNAPTLSTLDANLHFISSSLNGSSRLLFDIPFRFLFRFFKNPVPLLLTTQPTGLINLYDALRYIKKYV